MNVIKIILGSFALLFVLWVGFAVVWWQNNQEEVMQAVDQAVEEGQQIGRDSSDEECLQTYFDIMRDCKDMTCSIQNQVFLKSCLEYSNPTSALCASTPPQNELIKFAKWAAQTCIDQNIENSHCAAGLQEVAFYCEKPLSQ